MNTTTYSPLRQYPGNPRFSITRSRIKPHRITLNDNQYRQLAGLIADGIRTRKGTDEILFGNRFYNFKTKKTESSRRVFTGVEFLGDRQSYNETVFNLRSISLVGVFSLSGNKVPSDIDCSKLLRIINEKELIEEL